MSALEWLESVGERGPDESDAKRLLAAYGVQTPSGLLLERGRYAEPTFDGPFAVKAAVPGLMHKTEAGAIRTGVDRSRLEPVVRELSERFPDEDILVERMVEHAGIEFIVGAFRDPALGPAIMVGSGGVLAELYRDVAFRLVPCDEREIGAMIDELRIAPVLTGYRRIALDRAGLVRLVASVVRVVDDLGDAFGELDLNPVVCTTEAWVALDAKIVLAHPAR
jgi:hypothetical protein